MPTRCQTFITVYGKPVATIYRRCDGYPTGMGADLCNMILESTNPHDLVVAILTSTEFKAELEEIESKHPDIKYEYTVDFTMPAYINSVPTITVKSLINGVAIYGKGKDILPLLEVFGR